MSTLLHYLRRHTPLIVIALASSIMVVAFQTILTVFRSSQETTDMPYMYIESGEGVITTDIGQTSTTQSPNLIPDSARGEFESRGWYTLARQPGTNNTLQFTGDTLLLSLPTRFVFHGVESNGTWGSLRIYVGSKSEYQLRICENEATSSHSCTIYLASKSGATIPVMAQTYEDDGDQSVEVRLTGSLSPSRPAGIYRAPPLALHIRPI